MKETIKTTESEVKKQLENILKKAYSPYSKIKVGCALLFKNGDIICGCNIENASYSCTICAERCAVFNAVSSGKNLKDVQKVYIISDQKKLFYPCGACRQVMSEFLNENVEIEISSQVDKNLKDIQTLKNLLPLGFKL